MTLLVKKVEGEEVIPLYQILVDCGKEMHTSLNLSHWYPYADEQSFRASLEGKQLYGVYKDNEAIATFNVSTNPRDYYCESLWNIPSEKALYLGQLATKPSLQGNGIAKWCMTQVEMIAKELDCSVIRFDALESHPWLKSFYEHLGYAPCSIVKPGMWDLLCFDKRLG